MFFSLSAFVLVVFVCCCFADRIGRFCGVIDHPDSVRKRHARPTPLIGGLVLMVPLTVIAVFQGVEPGQTRPLLLVLGPFVAAFVLLGWVDDRNHLPASARLAVSTLLCTVLVVARPELQLHHLTFGPLTLDLGVMALPFTVLCLVGLQNAVNMADGLNGLVIGLSIFWVGCLLLYAPPGLVPFLVCLLLGLLVLLPFNLANRLFLGDAGSYALAILIGVLMIEVHVMVGPALPSATIGLWLLVPVLDCLRVMVARLIAGRSPFAADRDHLHHRIIRHWPWPVSVLTYLALAAGPGWVAAIAPSATPPMLVLSLLAYGVVIYLTRAAPAAVVERRDLPVAS